jgi:NADH dehydrogenase ubiquinone Fe-S protein 4
MKAIIYRPTKTAMQSGRGKSKSWVVEFDAETARAIDPLMGWTSSGDMRQELRLSFESEAAALAYCRKHGLAYELREPHARQVRPKSYADNFSYFSVRGPGSAPRERP